MVYLGLFDHSLPDQVNNIARFGDELSAGTRVLVICGVVIFIISFFGCWGAFTENTVFLKFVSISLIYDCMPQSVKLQTYFF